MVRVLYPPVIKFGQKDVEKKVGKYVRKIIENIWDEYVKNAPCDTVAAIVTVGAYVWLVKSAHDNLASAKARGWEASDWSLVKAGSVKMIVRLPNGVDAGIEFKPLKCVKDMTKKEYKVYMALRNIICEE